MTMKKLIIALVAVAVTGLSLYLIRSYYNSRLLRNPNISSGNGRLEATEINIAAKLPGKVEKVLVQEGDMVKAGQLLVKMQTNVMEAQLAQAKAERMQAITAEASARARIAVNEAILDSNKADYERIKVEEKNAESHYQRFKILASQDVASRQNYENAETAWRAKKAEALAAAAAIKQAEANVNAAKADAEGARANILAAEAKIATIQANIDDCYLKASVDGRIQYRIAEPGEALAMGGRALNMIDLSDVYMTFFLPEEIAGKVRIGAEVRIVLDALPDAPICAKVTYVASVAQFTPKTVETHIERQKLMFRIKAHVDRWLLDSCADLIKTGLPGVAWVKLNASAPWPKELWTLKEKGVDVKKLQAEIRGEKPDAATDKKAEKPAK